MIAPIIFSLVAGCSPTKIVNDTKVWSKIDKMNQERAQNRCIELYPSSPCLKVFWKTEINVYRAICGRKK